MAKWVVLVWLGWVFKGRLNTHQSIGGLITNVDDYIDFYNYRRFHQTLDCFIMSGLFILLFFCYE
ncbi:hypothetical protein [uncultured Gammaproteobacteria bacterium]|nr:hypothetical protein [uncultured Gammaproteobacteria bacterium]CAC9547853.1 hypothetical protein [uncultured Gammaproteobacteria bacterium]